MVAAETAVAAKAAGRQAAEHKAAATTEVVTREAEATVVACMAAVRTARASLDGCSPSSEPAVQQQQQQQQVLQQQRSLQAVVEGQQLVH